MTSTHSFFFFLLLMSQGYGRSLNSDKSRPCSYWVRARTCPRANKGSAFHSNSVFNLIQYRGVSDPRPPEPHHYAVKNVKELLTGQTAKPQNLHQYKVRIKYWDNEVEQLEKSASYVPGKTVLSVALNVALNKCKSLLTLQLYHICSMSFWGPVFFSENPEFIAQYIWKQ